MRQSIDGFGASSAWGWGTISSAALANIYSTTTGAGLSLLRSRLGPNGTTGENLMMQQVAAYGVRSWTTPWTPPREYKTNHDTNHGGSLDPARYQDYANHLANYVEDITRQGVPLYALSIQNEPNWTADYESCRWTAQQFADFLPYLGQTFATRGITTKIMLPEQLSWDFSLASIVMSNPLLAQYVDILAAHNYGETASSWKPYTNAGGRSVWETEISSFASGTEMDTAIDTANDIHQALTDGNANAYHYWWLSAGDAAGLTNNWTPTKRLWAMGQYSRFVRPDWVRIGESDDGGLDITTFKDPASGKFAIVVVNAGTSAINEAFTLNGVTATSVTPYVTSSTESLAQYTSVGLSNGTSFTFNIAPKSIVTFYGVSSTAPTLQPPTNLVAAPVQGNMTSRISLSWSDNSSSESSYTVERSPDGVNWTVLSTTVPTNAVSFTDTSRAENTRYHYRVKPTNGGAATYSAAASTSTILQAPSNVSGTRQSNGIRLTWTIGSGVSTGVSIDRSLDGLTWSNVANLASRATTYTDVIPGYSATQMYYYRVRNTVGGKYSAHAGWNSSLSAPTNFAAAQVTPGSVVFTWTSPMTGASGAWIQQYNSSTSSWTTVSPSSLQATDGSWAVTGLAGNTSYTFRMRLSANADSVYSSYSGTLNVTTPFQPIWYKANENSGTVLHDSFTAARDATLTGTLTFGAGVSGNALTLSGGHAALPAGIVSGVNDFTIAAWVRPSSLVDGARIFDFGTGTANSMYLVAQAAGTAGRPQFAITTSSGTQQIVSSVAIAPNTWTHIAVTLSGNTGTLYINGAAAGTNSNMTIHPASLGATTQNYLGRSQGSEPLFQGGLDDFQIWGRTFSAAEIQGLATPSVQLAWYKADETLGAVLSDSSGLRNDGTLSGSASFGAGVVGQAVTLSGGAGALPVGIVGGLNNFTIATWVKVSSLDNWARLFDFGTGTSNYMFLTLKPGDSSYPRFAITSGSGEQRINSSVAVPLNTWTHVAVTLSGNTGTMYINGVAVGSNSNMTVHPVALGATTQNYLGDSQFSNDPALRGTIDDFRIIARAYTATEVMQLAVPALVNPAAASANPVTSTTANLSALASDLTAGEPALTYTWSTTGTPPAPVTFSVNGSNAAKNTVATFAKAGTYDFRVTIVNPALAGVAALSRASTVRVVVNQTLTAVVVSPATASLNENGTRQFSATAIDQFSAPMTPQPAFEWSIASGVGSVSPGGLYTAPLTGGEATVRAAASVIAGTARVTVTNTPPTVATAASASPLAVIGAWTTSLSVLGMDAGGEANLTYTWSLIGTPPAPVTFSSNGTSAARNTTATFSHPGTYNFLVTITDAGSLTATSQTSVVVNSVVVGRHIFYNSSGHDGRNAAANARDDSAIDPTKTAWTGQQAATFTNYTGYTRGINGIMVDISRLGSAANLSAADFEIRVGKTEDPATWPLGPAPAVSVRPLANGVDRVTLIWPDKAIANAWVRVKVLATGNTGLAAGDVFCFGNQIGETGNSSTDAAVDAADVNAIVKNYTGFAPALVSNRYDLNHDLTVDALDANAAVNSYTGAASLRLLSPAAGDSAAYSAAITTVANRPATPAARPSPMPVRTARPLPWWLNWRLTWLRRRSM